LTPHSGWKAREGQWLSDTTKIIAVKQVSFAILSQRKHQLRGRGPRHIHERSADTTEIYIEVVEIELIDWRPVVGRVAAKNRAFL
jgi:hypothetical protein